MISLYHALSSADRSCQAGAIEHGTKHQSRPILQQHGSLTIATSAQHLSLERHAYSTHGSLRTLADNFFQLACASRAAAMARRVSSTSMSATWAISAPFAGLATLNVLPLLAWAHSPLMYPCGERAEQNRE